MKNLLRLEEGAQFMACLVVLVLNDASWWVYLLLVLGPDIGMLGYLVSTRVGAFTYNLLHHKAVAVVVLGLAAGCRPDLLPAASTAMAEGLLTAGLILFGHASMDRIFGYGLKFGDSFHHTHLGWIGKGGALSRGSFEP